MSRQRSQRGMALVTVLGILALFLLVSIVILTMTSQNSQNFGNAYQKQRYYNVAEAGIDRGLKDIDSALPPIGVINATPGPIPSPIGADQTPLPNVPGVPYHYSYWYNSSGSPASTPDPLASSEFCPSCTTVNVPPYGAVIWSYTDTGSRDVAVEAVASLLTGSTGSCAICAAQNVAVTGSDNINPPTNGTCGNMSQPFKVCSDPSPPPGKTPPPDVPIIAGGSYSCSGAEPAPCAYGDGSGSTPNPADVQQNASSSTVSGFLASQGAIDQLSDSNYWQNLSTQTSNVKWIDCSSGCSETALAGVAPGSNQITFVNGSITLSSNSTLSYSGTWIVSGCLSINGKQSLQGTSTSVMIVLGTDSQCGGDAANFSGGGTSANPAWNGGTLYAAQGSVYVGGNGSVRGYNFYGAVIAAGSVTVTGNGYFAWQSATTAQALSFGPFAIDSFAQY
jgi:hypothetical protein